MYPFPHIFRRRLLALSAPTTAVAVSIIIALSADDKRKTVLGVCEAGFNLGNELK